MYNLCSLDGVTVATVTMNIINSLAFALFEIPKAYAFSLFIFVSTKLYVIHFLLFFKCNEKYTHIKIELRFDELTMNRIGWRNACFLENISIFPCLFLILAYFYELSVQNLLALHKTVSSYRTDECNLFPVFPSWETYDHLRDEVHAKCSTIEEKCLIIANEQ